MKSPSPQTAIGRRPRALQRQRRADRDARAAADAAAAVGADIVERMAERPELAVPGQRDVGETGGAVADDVAQHVGHVGRGHLAIGRGLRLERMLAHEMRLLRLGLARDGVEQRRDGRVGFSRDEQVHRRQTLVVHAPAVVQVLVERDLDHGRRRHAADGLEGAAEIDPVEAEDHVGVLHRVDQVVGGEGRGIADVQRMIGRERRADLEVRRHARIDRLGELDAPLPVLDLPRHAAGQDQRLLGVRAACRPPS